MTFRVTRPLIGLIVAAAVAGSLRAQAPTVPFHTTRSIEFRLVEKGPGPGLIAVPTTGDVSEGVVFVRNTVEFDDRDIRSASAARDEYGLPSILVYLTPEGLKKCNAVLTANVGKQLAIIVADKAISLPMIEGGPLTDDSVRISGNFSVASVNALVKTLNKK